MLISNIFRRETSFIFLVLVLFLNGCTNDENRVLFEELRTIGEQGNAEAKYYVGMMLNNGVGVDRDLPKAFEWFQSAAAGGDPLAAYKVGCFFGGQFQGVVSIDQQESLKYKLIAAEAGYSIAQNDVGILYYKDKQFDKALRWWKLSAEQGFHQALFTLSNLYREGKAVPQNSSLAYAYFRLGQSMLKSTFSPDQIKQVGEDRFLSKEAQAHLDQLKWALSEDQLKKAEEMIASWKPTPTELTIKARSGLAAGKKLTNLSRN
jgi:TPR repeat protein